MIREEVVLRISFFVGSVVGYVDNPAALLTRGVAHGLTLRGNDVRIAEERQNQALTQTLRVAGSGASRHFYDQFRDLQYHTYDPRSGPKLLEWVARELSLIDAAVAVAGLDDELCRWIANVTREGLIRAYLTFQPEQLTLELADRLEIGRYDVVLAPSAPAAPVNWRPVPLAIASPDRDAGLLDHVPREMLEPAVDPVDAAEAFEQALTGRSSLNE